MNETATRILPCPSYDMEAVESWLTDQAKQGWYLERQGDYFGRFHFRKDVPRALPYRLVSSLESTTVLQQTRIHGSPPPQEDLDLAAYSGWEYVALIEGFYVYRGTTEHPREMETDPVLQSASIRKILGYKVLSFLVAIPLLFFRFFVFPPSSFRLSSLLWPTIAALVMFALIVSMGLVEFLLGMRYLHRRSQVLALGQSLDHEKPWQPKSKFWLGWKTCEITCFALFALFFLLSTVSS